LNTRRVIARKTGLISGSGALRGKMKGWIAE
jgi:hypothetical protein